MKLFNVFKELNIFLNINFNFLKKHTKSYTILRAPFVYKKSREQFFADRFKGWFYLSWFSKNFFFCWLFRKYINKSISFSFFV